MSLPFDVTTFKRCPKSRQVHARINPLDLNATRGDFTRRPEGEQGLPGKDQACKLEKRVGELRQKMTVSRPSPDHWTACLVRHFHVENSRKTGMTIAESWLAYCQRRLERFAYAAKRTISTSVPLCTARSARSRRRPVISSERWYSPQF
jgi:3-phenylpropionate/cinnamic acid dioxygenase small subunit